MGPLQRSFSAGNMSRSSPALAAAFNLRQYSTDRKKISEDDITISVSSVDAKKTKPGKFFNFEMTTIPGLREGDEASLRVTNMRTGVAGAVKVYGSTTGSTGDASGRWDRNARGGDWQEGDTLFCKAKVAQGPSYTLDEIDLIGGNGAWRQRKAEIEFERRRLEDEEKARQDKIAAEERARRKAEREERRRKQQEEMERRRQEERDRKQREAEERERLRLEAEERERLRREEEERERHRRAPKTCQTCLGKCLCQVCNGKGYYYATFLVSSVQSSTILDYGKKVQGCDNCGGCMQGVRGQIKMGSGKCPICLGYGKNWPYLGEGDSPTNKRGMQAWNDPNAPPSPTFYAQKTTLEAPK